MNRSTLRNFALIGGTLLGSTALVGCDANKTPAERVGDDLSKAGRNAKDVVAPPQTAGEKAGDAVDKAVGNK